MRENAYGREDSKQQLTRVEQQIAVLEAKNNRTPQEDQDLQALHTYYETLQSQFTEQDRAA